MLAARKGIRNVAWDQGDAYHLRYADGGFSIVVTRYSLHHLLDPQAALREMVRVCAPGGRIVVVDAYAPGRSRAGRGVPPCRDIARPVSCAGAQPDGIAGAVSEGGPFQTRGYALRAPGRIAGAPRPRFPNPGDEAELAEIFTAPDAAGRIGIPVYREAGKVHRNSSTTR